MTDLNRTVASMISALLITTLLIFLMPVLLRFSAPARKDRLGEAVKLADYRKPPPPPPKKEEVKKEVKPKEQVQPKLKSFMPKMDLDTSGLANAPFQFDLGLSTGGEGDMGLSFGAGIFDESRVDSKPVALFRTKPVYPSAAMAKNITGKVRFKMLVDADGMVVADSEKDPRSMENHRMRPEIMQAIEGRTGTALRYSSTVDENMLYVAVPLHQDGRTLCVVRMSLFMHDVGSLIKKFQRGMLWISLFVAAAALAAAFVISRRITRPIRMLSEAARNIATGNFDARVFLSSGDEVQECADSFNAMTVKIKSQFDEITLRREELENIIAAMHEHLLVLDSEGRIVLSNKSFNTFIGSTEVRGRFYWEFIREPEFGDMVRSVRLDRKDRIEELQLDGRVLLCSMAWIEQKEEIVAVCLDITEIKNVERIKKDFVVNVSHELRTPLTAIKGFIDTMLDEVNDQNHRRYLDIIKRHTDRLISIVKDLLTLARLEEDQHLDLEKVDLAALVEQVRKIYEQKLAEKKLTLDVSVGESVGTVRADPFKLEQVFINLIDNAVKYTEQGGLKISIDRDGLFVRITIQDTGIGMRSEHLSRIFERFYVVDKARSRQAGGTGLGLSIVKHIVLLHRGTIEVKSTVGRGTSFIIRLPENPDIS